MIDLQQHPYITVVPEKCWTQGAEQQSTKPKKVGVCSQKEQTTLNQSDLTCLIALYQVLRFYMRLLCLQPKRKPLG